MSDELNPLRSVFQEGRRVMKIAWSADAQRALPRTQYESFAKNEEERNYCQDVLARVGLLADAYDRLCHLREEWFVITAAKQENQLGLHIDLSKVKPEVLERDRQWKSDMDLTSSVFYYELKSVADMLRSWGIQVIGSELKYAARTRNWFLAHPRYGGVVRRAARIFSIPHAGGPAELSVTGLNTWMAVTRDYYIGELGLSQPIDEQLQREHNEQLVPGGKRSEALTAREILGLKAFGLREPRVRECAQELSDLLRTQLLPKITSAFSEALEFGFEPM